ncbi:MAG: hypothetical protein A2W93_01170 [Bacteroidetes bacterium GWF2_43_63]|nr:MAG: hypothetical protein A2W94_10900 [Bacteroidetes bacterium GWE2_42_42]OFY55689.1 MAG: hypothetical protein A2W93_01170 [Bacteroidetes bacterium GWF2_43_63]
MSGNVLAQVGISSATITPDASAMLEVRSTTSGMLIPRVALTGTASALPVTAPAISLLVYNTAAVSDVTPGFYYWSGSAWVRILSGTSTVGWALLGNTGTVSGTNFLGTTDAQALDFRTNNTIRLRVANGDQVMANALGTAALPFWTYVADPNTGAFSPGADILGYSTAGVERFRMSTTEAVVNDQSNDYDFRVESNTAANMFFVDGGNDHVLINSTTYTAGDIFSVYNSTAWNATNPWLINSYNSHTSGGSGFFENSDSGNGYNALEGSTAGTYSGLFGLHIANNGAGYGVYGSSNSNSGWGGYFIGDIYVDASVFTASDERWKKEIKPIENALDAVMQLEPKSYKWRADEFPGKHFDPEKTSFGFVAQDLEKVFPQVVTNKKFITDPTIDHSKTRGESSNVTGYYMVDYISLVPVLTKAIQEQQTVIETLEQKIQQLEQRLNALEK